MLKNHRPLEQPALAARVGDAQADILPGLVVVVLLLRRLVVVDAVRERLAHALPVAVGHRRDEDETKREPNPCPVVHHRLVTQNLGSILAARA